MSERDTSDRFERYVNHLESLTGVTMILHSLPQEEPGTGRVLAVICEDFPEAGHITGFSYGLSLADHRDWRATRPELTITVRSGEPDWAIVPARLANVLRGRAAFRRGQVVCGLGRLVESSPMRCLLVADPVVGPVTVDLSASGGGDVVGIVGMYPVHAAERDLVNAGGMDEFWALPWDRYDPARPPAVESGRTT
jgi:hypothetical protein